MPGYQHWLPKAYLRGFAMSDEWFKTLKPDYMGLSRESVFVARLPDLTRPWECDGYELEWRFANLSEIGGSVELHATEQADVDADADLKELGPILKRIRKEMAAQAAGPTTVPDQGGPDEVELPSPVRTLASVVERPDDVGILLRAIAVGKFRGPYSDNLKVRDMFEKVLSGLITREQVEDAFAEPSELRDDLMLLVELQGVVNAEGADPRLMMNALWLTVEMAHRYLPDGQTVHGGHALLKDDEEALARVLAMTYESVGELYLLNNMIEWTCDAPFFHLAPGWPQGAEETVSSTGFNVGVQLSSGIYLTNNATDTSDPGAFFAAGRANPLYGVAQWLISPEPLEEVSILVSNRPWEQPLPAADSMDAWAASIFGWGRAPLTMVASQQEPRHWASESS